MIPKALHSSFRTNNHAHLDFLLSFGSFMANIWTVPLSLEQQRNAESRLKLMLQGLRMETFTCTCTLMAPVGLEWNVCTKNTQRLSIKWDVNITSMITIFVYWLEKTMLHYWNKSSQKHTCAPTLLETHFKSSSHTNVHVCPGQMPMQDASSCTCTLICATAIGCLLYIQFTFRRIRMVHKSFYSIHVHVDSMEYIACL